MHPAILARLREEVLSHVGASRRPTYDDIRDMKYLRAFINGKRQCFCVVKGILNNRFLYIRNVEALPGCVSNLPLRCLTRTIFCSPVTNL